MAVTRALDDKVHCQAWAQKAECSSSAFALNGRLGSQVSPTPPHHAEHLTGWQWYTPSGCLKELCIETGNWAQGVVVRPYSDSHEPQPGLGGSGSSWSCLDGSEP